MTVISPHRPAIDLRYRMQSARPGTASGDAVGAVERPNGRVGICVVDAPGHGPAAAEQAAVTRRPVRVTLGERRGTNVRLPRQSATRSAVRQLLRDMKPFIRKVHVLKPGKNGAPPILGGTPAGVHAKCPSSLQAYPSERWVVTPQIERHHRDFYGAMSHAKLRSLDHRSELQHVAVPLLQRRYADRSGLTAIELGSATSTIVPQALGDNVERYFATDLSLPLLELQRDLLNEPDYQVAGAYQVQGDTYDLPYESGIADVLFTSCHPPFFSSSPAERIQAFAEVARVLKPGGEFVVLPFEREQHPAVSAFINKHFDQVDRAATSRRGDRHVVVFRKKS